MAQRRGHCGHRISPRLPRRRATQPHLADHRMGRMNRETVICSMCGHRFNADQLGACHTCPLHKSCNLLCCPYCGYQMVHVRRSRLARLASRLLARSPQPRTSTSGSLVTLPPGRTARVVALAPSLPPARQAYLQACGLVPGCQIRIVQQSPVTVVRFDHTELALERELAEAVQVESD
ncbi:MAG: hypothetical protein D6775_08905 [Caldilineae bacterium]|nr:MAG: hypothetical protein D6775_08905 [Caldilineae bacterium]